MLGSHEAVWSLAGRRRTMQPAKQKKKWARTMPTNQAPDVLTSAAVCKWRHHHTLRACGVAGGLVLGSFLSWQYKVGVRLARPGPAWPGLAGVPLAWVHGFTPHS